MRPRKHTNTIPLKFGQKSSVLRVAHPSEGLLIRMLSCALFLLLAGYITLVSMSIVNVIARKEAMEKTVALRSSVSELEHNYFVLSQGISADRGQEFGLVKVSDTHYVREQGSVGFADDKNVRNGI